MTTHPVEERTVKLYSVGHSTQPLDAFVEVLCQHDVQVVADVRTSPFSRFNPQFNRRDLELGLRSAGIDYVFLGQELGGRPGGEEFYDPDDHVLYGRMAESPVFRTGLNRLIDGANQFRVAMMCSEDDPAECHRFLLITRVLQDQGIDVTHIRSDGSSQRTEDVRTYDGWSAGDHEQRSLFDEPARSPWRSIRSVSPRRQPQSSSRR